MPIKSVLLKEELEPLKYIIPILSVVFILLVLVIIVACLTNKKKVARQNREVLKLPAPLKFEQNDS